jgi:hypothetical protein
MRWWAGGRQLDLLLPALASAGCLLLGDSAYAQTIGDGESIEIPFVRIFAGLILAVLIALGAALVLKRQGGGRLDFKSLMSRQLSGRAPRRIRIHETHRLSPHADLCRFSAANKEYLVIVSPNSTHVLSVSEEEYATPANQPAGQAAR